MFRVFTKALKSNFSGFFFARRSNSTKENLCKVSICQGDLLGEKIILPSNKVYYSYQGIPYAKPPVGKLRFKPPQPPEPWSGVRDATVPGNVCVHRHTISGELVGDEDCLVLNVYTPKYEVDEKLPVMVYLHGGAYAMGSGNNDIYGPDYLVEQDVVLVTVNYRLALLGFLTLNTPDVPGNAGLRDQLEALRWVRRNISRFGGDHDNVTLFGESAGGACAQFLHLSSLGKDLFKRIIIQSGNAIMEWSCNGLGVKRSHMIGEYFGYKSKNPDELLEFLQQVPAIDLYKSYNELNTPDEKRRGLPIPLGPTIEEKFDGVETIVPAHPIDILRSGNFDKIPIMFGYNDCEGMAFQRASRRKLNDINNDFERMIPKFLNVKQKSPAATEVANEIKKFYFGEKSVNEESIAHLFDLLTDYNFGNGMNQLAHLCMQMENVPAYFYRFSYVGHLNLFKKIWGDNKFPGACHGDDLFYLFKPSFLDLSPEVGSIDELVLKRMVKMWTNFAKFGNPTPVVDNIINVKWEPIRKSSLNFLHIGNDLRMCTNPDKDRVDFWKNLYIKYNGDFANIKYSIS